MSKIKLINENGVIKGVDPSTGNEVPVEFDDLESTSLTTEDVGYTTGKANRLKIGIISDLHYSFDDPGRANEIPGKTEAESIMDTFIDHMNDRYRPDIVVFNGDMIDADSDKSTFLNWIDSFRSYFEENGGTDGNGLDAPIHYTLGNHEYAQGDDVDVYNAFGFDSFEDTYRSLDIRGVKVLLLNNSYNDQDYFAANNAHELPDAELEWLKDEIEDAEDNGQPIFPFMHVPPVKSNDTYQTFVNMDEVRKVFNRSNNFVTGFIAHDHNPRRVVRRIDEYGGHWVLTPPCQGLHDNTNYDTSVRSYATATLAQDGSSHITTSYDDDRYVTEWDIDTKGETATPVGTTEHTFDHWGFLSKDGWEDYAGTLSRTDGKLELTTGSTTDDDGAVLLEVALRGMGWRPNPAHVGWQIQLNMVYNTGGNDDAEIYFWALTNQGDNYEHIGFEIDDRTLYGSVADGSDRTRVILEDSMQDNYVIDWRVAVNYPDSVIFKKSDVASEDIRTITTNIPAEVKSNRLIDWRHWTREDAQKKMTLRGFRFHLGKKIPDFSDFRSIT